MPPANDVGRMMRHARGATFPVVVQFAWGVPGGPLCRFPVDADATYVQDAVIGIDRPGDNRRSREIGVRKLDGVKDGSKLILV